MRRVVLCGWLAFCGASAAVTAQDPPAAEANGEIAVELQLAADGLLTTQVEHVEQSKYWIGLSCEPVDDALRSQLGLESNTGLVIRQVVDEGPAKAAGMQVHDIITQVQIGDETHKPADIAHLTNLVKLAETKPMTFSLLRGGKPTTIAVTPAERAAVQARFRTAEPAVTGHEIQGALNQQIYFDWIRSQPPQANPNVMIYRMAGPVLALTHQTANLPDDITVIIKKTGSAPAEIIVQQKDQGEWKLTQGELAEQPDHVNKAVSNALAIVAQMTINGRIEDGKSMIKFEPRPHFHTPRNATSAMWLSRALMDPATHVTQPVPVAPAAPVLSATPVVTEIPSLQQQLNQLQQQQEQLTKALNDLRQALEKTQPKE